LSPFGVIHGDDIAAYNGLSEHTERPNDA